MLSEKMAKALNEQVTAEFYSAWYYLSMAVWAAKENFDGTYNFMTKQAKEEEEHAMKFIKYILDSEGEVKLGAIKEPPKEFSSLKDIFAKALEHEKYVTSLIKKLVELAYEEKDYTTLNFLQWFLEEQVEEESTMSSIHAKLEMVGESRNGLFMIDSHLGQR